MGRSAPGGTFRGAGKIEVMAKNLEREKAFLGGEILGRS